MIVNHFSWRTVRYSYTSTMVTKATMALTWTWNPHWMSRQMSWMASQKGKSDQLGGDWLVSDKCSDTLSYCLVE